MSLKSVLIAGFGLGANLLATALPASIDFHAAHLFTHQARKLIMASMTASALLKSRVRRPSMLSKLAKTSDLIDLFPNGASVGWSGFTGVGYPK